MKNFNQQPDHKEQETLLLPKLTVINIRDSIFYVNRLAGEGKG